MSDVIHMYSASEAEQLFAIPASTIRSWKRRGLIGPAGLDARMRPLYDRADLFRLRDAGKQTEAA